MIQNSQSSYGFEFALLDEHYYSSLVFVERCCRPIPISQAGDLLFHNERTPADEFQHNGAEGYSRIRSVIVRNLVMTLRSIPTRYSIR